VSSIQREVPPAQTALFCTFCGRKIPVNFFTNSHGESRVFHPLTEHRYFCIWGKIDIFGKKVYGWNICLNFLYDRTLKGTGHKSIFDKRNEISKLNFELSKGMESIKKVSADTEQKMSLVNDLALKYNLTSDLNEFKDKLHIRRQSLDDIINEIGDSLEVLATKKLK
jgi:hypothetical protein